MSLPPDPIVEGRHPKQGEQGLPQYNLRKRDQHEVGTGNRACPSATLAGSESSESLWCCDAPAAKIILALKCVSVEARWFRSYFPLFSCFCRSYERPSPLGVRPRPLCCRSII